MGVVGVQLGQVEDTGNSETVARAEGDWGGMARGQAQCRPSKTKPVTTAGRGEGFLQASSIQEDAKT